jgi:Coenzyme PQQ synthesis protein D (PqqD)
VSVHGRTETPVGESAAARFMVEPDRVVHETIDNETILIDLDTGIYYSLTGSGAEIWGLLSSGVALADAAEVLRRRYPSEGDWPEHELHRLTRELVAEGLLVQSSATATPPFEDGEVDRPFEAPMLHRYADMEYFLRLDPIHEVDEAAGWPEPRA